MNRACFPKEKHQNSQKWAKFMNFLFWLFLWFGLPGPLPIPAFCLLAYGDTALKSLFLLSQRRRDDNKNKILGFDGGGPWGQRGKSSQTLFFFFRGKRHDNKILKVQILLSKNFVTGRMSETPTTDSLEVTKGLSMAQAASLCSAGMERAQKCLQGEHFVRCCQSTHSLLQEFSKGCGGGGGGSAAVCNLSKKYRTQYTSLCIAIRLQFVL